MIVANVYHFPGLCLLATGGAPYISHKIMTQKPYFHIFEFSETTNRGALHRFMPRFMQSSGIDLIILGLCQKIA